MSTYNASLDTHKADLVRICQEIRLDPTRFDPLELPTLVRCTRHVREENDWRRTRRPSQMEALVRVLHLRDTMNRRQPRLGGIQHREICCHTYRNVLPLADCMVQMTRSFSSTRTSRLLSDELLERDRGSAADRTPWLRSQIHHLLGRKSIAGSFCLATQMN